MVRTVHGIVHGNTIEVTDPLGMAEGQLVEVAIKASRPLTPWGEGLRRCAGALTNEWTTDDDRILDEIYQDRRHDTRKDISG